MTEHPAEPLRADVNDLRQEGPIIVTDTRDAATRTEWYANYGNLA